MKNIKIILFLFLFLIITGCDDGGQTKELSCSIDMTKYFVEEANYDESITSEYNRTVNTTLTFVYNEKETEIQEIELKYVATATGTNYKPALDKLSYELKEECKRRGFLTCEGMIDADIYTITGSNDELKDVEAYMSELNVDKDVTLTLNKESLVERGYSCIIEVNNSR